MTLEYLIGFPPSCNKSYECTVGQVKGKYTFTLGNF